MSLQPARSSKKNLAGPTAFCKRGIYCQRKSKWTARAPSSKFFRENGHWFQWCFAKFFP